jgi:type IV fimbrial biogenesis protein FimT
MKSNFKQVGFSLIELMVVMAIIAIVAGVAFPSYQDFIQNTRIRTTTESMLAGLQKARTEALRRNANVRFDLDASFDGSWKVGCVNVVITDEDGDGEGDCPAEIEKHKASEASADIDVATDTGSGITFTSMGVRKPDVADINKIDVDMSGMNPSDSRNLQIQVGAGGSVRMCDPTVTDLTDSRACLP